MPEVTNNQGNQSADTLDNISANTFGSISLLTNADTATLVEFPVQKGYSTWAATPEDFNDSISAGLTDTIPVLSDTIATAVDTTAQVQEIVGTDTTQLPENSLKDKPFTEFDETVFRINYAKIGQMENGWIFWSLLASLVVFGITKIVFKKNTESIFSHTFNYNFAQKEFQKTGENSQIATIILQCLFAFNAGLFIFFAFKINTGNEYTTIQSIIQTSILTGSILTLYFIKKLFFYFVAGIFDRHDYARECVFNIYLYNRALGICLYPIVIALAFIKPNVISPNVLLIIGYIVIGMFYLFRIYREIQISLKNRVSFFYIFLYFCTLEILPILLLVKILTSIVFAELNIL